MVSGWLSARVPSHLVAQPLGAQSQPVLLPAGDLLVPISAPIVKEEILSGGCDGCGQNLFFNYFFAMTALAKVIECCPLSTVQLSNT
jgi:hypothetical protein